MNEPHDQQTRMQYIPGYEKFYMATYDGKILRLPRKVKRRNDGFYMSERSFMKTGITYRGYEKVGLALPGESQKTHNVHVLIALTFLGSRPPGMIISHTDHNQLNNHGSNLKYITQSQNVNDSNKKRKMTSNYPGVSKRKNDNKYTSEKWIYGQKIIFGRFDKEIDAANAYKLASEMESSGCSIESIKQKCCKHKGRL